MVVVVLVVVDDVVVVLVVVDDVVVVLVVVSGASVVVVVASSVLVVVVSRVVSGAASDVVVGSIVVSGMLEPGTVVPVRASVVPVSALSFPSSRRSRTRTRPRTRDPMSPAATGSNHAGRSGGSPSGGPPPGGGGPPPGGRGGGAPPTVGWTIVGSGVVGAGTVGSFGGTAGRPVGFVFAQSSSDVGSYPSSAIGHFPTLRRATPVARVPPGAWPLLLLPPSKISANYDVPLRQSGARDRLFA